MNEFEGFENPQFILITASICCTMAGFEDSCPKTHALNLAPAGAILFQFKIFQNLEHNPQIFESW